MADDIQLRDVVADDLPIFFEQQLDPAASAMAAFPSREREPFMAHWAKILRDDRGVKQTILADGRVAGNVVCYEQDGDRLVGYWLGRDFWGQGIATRALALLLRQLPDRPLRAYVAKHNRGSIRVLEKCGFVITGEERSPADEHGEGTEEWIMTLAGAP